MKILKFWAPWCAPCKMLGPILADVVDGTDVEVLEINVDEMDGQTIAVKYGVRGIPTLIFIDGEDILEKKVGTVSKAELQNLIEKHTK